MHLLVLLQPQCTHTQLLLLAAVLVFHSLTAFVSSLPQVQTSHAEPGRITNLINVCIIIIIAGLKGRGLIVRPHISLQGEGLRSQRPLITIPL